MHDISNHFCTPSVGGWLAAVLIGIIAMCAIKADAQERLPLIPADKMTDAQKKAAEEFRAARQVEVFGPFAPMLRSPELMSRAAAMGQYLRYNSVLPARMSELVILLTARQWSQSYEWAIHQPIALAAGLSDATVRAIAEGRRPDRMAEDEAILYDFCDELHRTQNISDATYARTVGRFGEQGVIDTLGIVGYYTMLAMVLNVARVPPDPGAPILPPLK